MVHIQLSRPVFLFLSVVCALTGHNVVAEDTNTVSHVTINNIARRLYTLCAGCTTSSWTYIYEERVSVTPCGRCYTNVTIDITGAPHVAPCQPRRTTKADEITLKHLSREPFLSPHTVNNSVPEYQIDPSTCRDNTVFHAISDVRGVVTFASREISIATCYGRITVPEGFAVEMEIEEIEDVPGLDSCQQLLLKVSVDEQRERILFSDTSNNKGVRFPCYKGKHSVIFSFQNTLYFRFQFNPSIKSSKLLNTRQVLSRFRFKSTLQSGRFNFIVHKTNHFAGYVSSGLAQGRPYFPAMDASYVLTPPKGLWSMVSFPVLEVGNDNTCVQRHVWQMSNFSQAACKRTFLLLVKLHPNGSRPYQMPGLCPRIERGKKWVSRHGFFLFFHTVSESLNLGFKMHYTFYSKRGLNSSVFTSDNDKDCRDNLTVSYDSVKSHFHCNLLKECKDSFDEIECPFSHPDCGFGPGVEDVCLSLIKTNSPVTWSQARESCQTRGGDLASLNSAKKWVTVKAMFDHGYRRFPTFVGISKAHEGPSANSSLYRFMWQWFDQTVAFQNRITLKEDDSTPRRVEHECGYIDPKSMSVVPYPCQETYNEVQKNKINVYDILCEVKIRLNEKIQPPVLPYPQLNVSQNLARCPQGHLTKVSLYCEVGNQCRQPQPGGLCEVPHRGLLPMFRCDNNRQVVHFTLVCDIHRDCQDGSDEDFCVGRPCREKSCLNGQCMSESLWCDYTDHCGDGSDEAWCNEQQIKFSFNESLSPPAVVEIDQNGVIAYGPLNEGKSCPDTHFVCRESYCLPVFLRCNGVYDCPFHEDELDCGQLTCPGLYRCRDSILCLHPDHLCDVHVHCPRKDDEVNCGERLSCPEGCQCQAQTFRCDQRFSAVSHPDLRFVDASRSGMGLAEFESHFYLVELRLQECHLRNVSGVLLPNLRVLNLAENMLTTIDMKVFTAFGNLYQLYLSFNPLVSLVSSETTLVHRTLTVLNASHTELTVVKGNVFAVCPLLSVLSLSYSPVHTILPQGFAGLEFLRVLNLTGCPVENFPVDVLKTLSGLKTMFTENHKLCCQATLPRHFDPSGCFAPRSEVSSCQDLLRSSSYRVCLWVFAILSVLGNSGCFLLRLMSFKSRGKSSFTVLVMSLSLSDLLMGVFLVIIGAADIWYRGRYPWHSSDWTGSVACKVAGFLALLASEVSAFVICLITLDRFLALRFPFSRFHFGSRSSAVVSGLMWGLGITIAALPLLPTLSHWQFYGQTGICIPLPITRINFLGRDFSFGVMIVFNSILFMWVATGQAVIYTSVRSNMMTSSESSKKSQDVTIARRLISVAVSDFLCWFPVGLLGLLAYNGVPIPGEVNVGMAIFVLPLNSALNPFLYTFSMLVERRQKARQRRVMAWFEANCPCNEITGGASGDDQLDASTDRRLADTLSYLKAMLSSNAVSSADILESLNSVDSKYLVETTELENDEQ